MPAQVLLEDYSPHGTVQAIVEQDGRCCYFYLWGHPDTEFGIRRCWVRNLRRAPIEPSTEDAGGTKATMLAKACCRHPIGAEPLVAERLHVVWSEAGDAAALYEDDQLLAIIPPWSGVDGFHGYSRDCSDRSPVCWPLEDAAASLRTSFDRAAEYWQAWDAEPNPWPAYQSAAARAYSAAFGAPSSYYAIDEDDWPPRALLRFDRPDETVFATVGCGLRVQPTTSDRPAFAADERPSGAARWRRIELGFAFRHPVDSALLKACGQFIGVLTDFPWSHFTSLEHGRILRCDPLAELTGGLASDVLLVADAPLAPNATLPAFRHDPVALLWMLPISESEREWAVAQGSDALVRRLIQAAVDWRPPARRPSTA